MYTLVYLKGQFNRPDTLLPFLQSNIGQSPQLRVDCIDPYKGTVEQLQAEVCEHLSKMDSHIEVLPNIVLNQSTESNSKGEFVSYLVLQVLVQQKQC